MHATRRVLLTAVMGLLGAHRVGRAQPAAAMRRVGYLGASTTAIGGYLRDAFKQGMRDFGWIEGSNVEYRIAWSGTAVDRFEALAADLIGQQVDVIVSPNVQAAVAAQKATKMIPIVFIGASDPVGLGLVASLARPGGNITGMATQNEDVLRKRIEILHQAVPTARRIAILLNDTVPTPEVFWAAAEAACASLGLVALRVVASTPAQFGAAAEQIVNQRAQAVVVVSSLLYYLERERLHEHLQTTRLPVVHDLREQLGASGLLSYGVDLAASFRYLAKWVDKILRGAKPADLPVERPTQFTLVINLKAAKALGLTIPQAVLLRADEVIE